MTNGEKIRSMTDDEMADMLHNIGPYVEDGNPLLELWIGDEQSIIDDDIYHIKEFLRREVR